MGVTRLAVTVAVMLACATLTARAQSRGDGRPIAVLLNEADSLFRAGRNDDALARYQAVLQRDSSISRAVFQAAVLHSWANDHELALRLHARYIGLEPNDLEGHVAYARVFSWAGQFAAAIARYDTVLAREPDYRDAALGRAQSYAWWGRFGDADAAYSAWIAKHPTDSAAIFDRARAWSMAGRLDEALVVFRRMSGREAAKAAARVLAWQGDLVGAEAMWESLTRDQPADAEAWVELARVRRWLDRPRAARDALDNAVRARPGYADALEQRQWVDADLRPSVGVTLSRAIDSDENETWTFSVGGSAAMPIGRRLSMTASSRRATIGVFDATANSLRGAWGLQSASGRAGAAFDLAVSQLHSEGPGLPETDDVLMSGGARVSAQVGERISLGAGLQRAPYDEVASSIRTGVALDYGDVEATLRLPLRLRFAATANRGAAVRGTDGSNARWGAGAALQWSISRNSALAVSTRAFGYERTAADGYFSPRRFQISQVGARWHSRSDLGWQFGGEAGIGRQRLRLRDELTPAERSAWNVSGSAGFRWRPGVEWFSSASFANVAAPGAIVGDAEYRHSSFSVGVRRLF